MTVIEYVLNQVKELPALPQAIAKLSKLVSDPNSTASDFENTVRPDLSLTVNLLKMANSAYFGFSREITSIRQAITLMGQTRVFELAVGSSFSQLIPKVIPGYDVPASQFWLHGIGVAVFSEQLSKELKITVPDMTFTAGLLHDIGKIILGPFLEKQKSKWIEHISRSDEMALQIEQDLLGTTHAEVGALLSQIWNLPSTVEQCTLWHHQPTRASLDLQRNLIDIVHVADIMAHVAGLGSDNAGLLRALDTEAMVRLGITPELIQKIILKNLDEIKSLAKAIMAPARS